MASARPIPLHFFTDDSVSRFQETIRKLFLGQEDRLMVKRCLKLFAEKIVITLPTVESVGKTDPVLCLLQNKEAVRTNEILTAVENWLPGTDSCKNYKTTLFIKGKQGVDEDSASVKGEEMAGLERSTSLGAQ